MSSSADKGFPVDVETLLASMFELLKELGAAREIAILQNSNAHGTERDYDNWSSETCSWSLQLELEISIFGRLSDKDRKDASKILEQVATPFFEQFPHDHFSHVSIMPKAVDNAQWRQQAGEYLRGAGISNQGRVRSDNIASKQVDGLLFRSEPEINLYRAFKALGLTFAPLPVFLRGGATFARLEPDFVIIKDGVVMVVEVDGDTYHRESPVDAHQRLIPLDHEGAKIERIRATECETAESAKACAMKLLQVLQKRVAQSRH